MGALYGYITALIGLMFTFDRRIELFSTLTKVLN
jgi:hypothetical protein